MRIPACSFGGEEQAELAGLAHDIGKYAEAFQKRLHGGPIQVDHATAGAAECWRLRQPFAAFAVAGHHGGLPDGGSRTDGPEQATLLGCLKRKERGLLEPYETWRQEIQLPQASVPAFARAGMPKEKNRRRRCFSEAFSVLADREHVNRIGDTTVVCWARSGGDAYMIDFAFTNSCNAMIRRLRV